MSVLSQETADSVRWRKPSVYCTVFLSGSALLLLYQQQNTIVLFSSWQFAVWIKCA